MIERPNDPGEAMMDTLRVPAAKPDTRHDLRCEAEVTGAVTAMLAVATGAALEEGQRGLAIGAGLVQGLGR
jgi:hypothetical protein